jgi:hypothetical protein
MSGTNSDNFFGQFLIIKRQFYFYYRKRFKYEADDAKQLHDLRKELTRRALKSYSSLPLLFNAGSHEDFEQRPKMPSQAHNRFKTVTI